MDKRPLKKILISAIILIGVLFVFNFIWAQEEIIGGLEELEQEVDMYEKPIPGSMASIIINAVRWIMGIIGALAVAMIAWGGLQYITSAGNEKKIEQAKQVLVNAIIGFVLSVLAQVILWAVTKAIEAGGG